jgi:hypothetical protein
VCPVITTARGLFLVYELMRQSCERLSKSKPQINNEITIYLVG